MTILSIPFCQSTQYYHHSASRQSKILRNTICLRTSTIPLPFRNPNLYRHLCNSLKFGTQCVGQELASCITNHICSWSCCCCCRNRIRLQYSLSRGDECRTFHLLKQAVQSTYNSAKRRMVSVRKLPVGVRHRFAMSPISQGRSRQRRFPWHFRIPEQPTQSSSPIASTLLPEGMQGVEHNTLSNISPIPASSNAVAWEATILPSIFDGSASYSRKVNGAFLPKISPPPSKFVSSPNELLSNLDAPQGVKSHGHQSKLTRTGSSDIKG